MQVRNPRNRLRVYMVCEWTWVSIPGERDLPKSLIGAFSWSSDHTYRCVRTHAHKQASARIPYYHGIQTKTEVDVQ